MIGFVMIGTNNLGESSKFYDAILSPLGIKKVITTERYIGYAKINTPKKIEFYLMKPYNKEPATVGNGTMITFFADSKDVVDDFSHSTCFPAFAAFITHSSCVPMGVDM